MVIDPALSEMIGGLDLPQIFYYSKVLKGSFKEYVTRLGGRRLAKRMAKCVVGRRGYNILFQRSTFDCSMILDIPILHLFTF